MADTHAATLCWSIAPLLIIPYVATFLARQNVSLRPARLALPLNAPLLPRLGVLLGGEELERWEVPLLVAVGMTTLALLAGRSHWLLRASSSRLREQIDSACRGLLLRLQEPRPGQFLLGKEEAYLLQIRSVSTSIQWISLSKPSGGKSALFVNWFARQYPGPIPPVTIELKGASA